MKKGFTLIELLAVIVILAIIALIATPVVLNIIDNTRESSSKISIDNIEYAVKLYYSKKQLNGISVEDTLMCFEGKCVNSKGEQVEELSASNIESGTISISPNGVITYSGLLVNGYVFDSENGMGTSSATLFTVEGTQTVRIDNFKSLSNYRIYGNMGGVGNLDSSTGRYVVPITVKGSNLFDYKQIANSSSMTVSDEGLEIIGYQSETNITPEMFLAMTGLNEGDSFYASDTTTILAGTSNGVLGRISFLKKNKEDANYKNFHLLLSGDSTQTSIIPSGFNSDNFSTMSFIGVHTRDEAGNRLSLISDIMISTDSAVYEPYRSERYNISLSRPLNEGEYIDFQRHAVLSEDSDAVVPDIVIQFPNIEFLSGVNKIIIETTTSPKKIEFSYIK